MKELIDPHQAQLLMIGVLLSAPIIGLIWGLLTKRLVMGIVIGLAVGMGNYALWTVYNAITDRLGLDTVKNLLVNLMLFTMIGIAVGLAAGFIKRRHDRTES